MKNLKKYMSIMILIVTLIVMPFSFVFAQDSDESENLEIYSNAAILMDSRTGKILYDKNAKKRMYPASTTKILTAILTIENCKLDEIATVDEESIMLVPSGYTVAALQVGEELTVKQLLQLLLIPSANDAANVLAKHVSGSIEAFCDMMNNKAKELGCLDSHFVNPNGKHDDDHYSTAYDLALIMNYCIKNETFLEITSSSSCIIPATNKYEERVFSNTNEMLRMDTREISSNYYYEYLIASKTGYTSEANNCLVAAADKNDFKLISVVLDGIRTDEGLSARCVDTKTLFEYGYNTYAIRKLRESGSIAKEIEIENATRETKNLDLLLTDDIIVLVKQKDMNTEFEPTIKLNDNLEAPITKGDFLGTITYNIEGIEYTSDIIASHSVEKDVSLFFILIVIAIIVILFILYKKNIIGNKKSSSRKYKF